MKYSGVDLHSNNSVVTVVDEEDRVVAEKRLLNDLAKVLGFLLPWKADMAVRPASIRHALHTPCASTHIDGLAIPASD